MKAFEPNLNLIFLLLPFAGVLIGTFIAVKFIHGQPLLKLTTTRAKIDWNRAIFAFTLWGIFTSLMLFVDYSFTLIIINTKKSNCFENTLYSTRKYSWNIKSMEKRS